MSKSKVTVVGAANVDIIATPSERYRPGDSNPSRVEIGFGGVGRNIAHNLALLGHDVTFLTTFGDDHISHALRDDCVRIGLDVSHCSAIAGARSNYFVCVNDHLGEMQSGAADMELVSRLTPELVTSFFARHTGSQAVVADCNLSAATLTCLAQQCRVPLYIDATSAAKAVKIPAALADKGSEPVVVKLNRVEAQVLTGITGDVEAMARWFITRHVERVYITLGAQGVYCRDSHAGFALPTQSVPVVNATGAGDAFMSGVIHSEMSGLSMLQAATKGLEAAAQALQCTTAVSHNITSIIDT